MEEEIIKYTCKNIRETESIKIFSDRVIYEKINMGITGKFDKKSTKDYQIIIEDKSFISEIILEKIYAVFKDQILEKYNKVRKMDIRKINRPKNTSIKDLKNILKEQVKINF